MRKQRTVKKSGNFSGTEGLQNKWALVEQISRTVSLRAGEYVESTNILSDQMKTKVTLVSNKGPGKIVYRITGFPEGPIDIDSLTQARTLARTKLKENPGVTITIDKVVLKDGHPVGTGQSELLSRRITIEVTVVKD